MRTGNSKGQALAEFIIVIPLLLVVMLGVVQFSLLYFAYQMVHYASFAAARAAIVRPCAAFQPNDSGDAHFTPAVFTAATLATAVAMPPQCLVSGITRPGQKNPCLISDLDAFPFLPQIGGTPEMDGLGYDGVADGPSGELALTKYINAAYLTSVQRVDHSGLVARPIVWTPNPDGPGPGIPCDGGGVQEQNVPAPGDDVTLEVTLVYPLIVPLVNRVIFGIFVNFSSMAQDRLNLPQIFGSSPDPGPEDVMVHPTRSLAPMDGRLGLFSFMLGRIFQEFGYSGAADAGTIAQGLADLAWFPVPIRARCTLTTEGAMYPMAGPPTSRGW
jgi:hypothetical protein